MEKCWRHSVACQDVICHGDELWRVACFSYMALEGIIFCWLLGGLRLVLVVRR